MRKPVISLVTSLILALCSLSVAAQIQKPQTLPENVPALLVKADQAYASKDYLTYRKALEKLHALRPNNSDYMYRLVNAYALLNEKSQAYNLMLQMQKQGLAYDFSISEDTANISETQAFEYVNDLMKTASKPMGLSEPVFELPGDVLMPEAISWDESRQKFLVGTISKGQIMAVGMDGQVNELLKADAENGLWAVLDILVDQAGNRLWVTSASMPGFSAYDPVDKGRSSLFEFNLETLELIRSHPVPVDGKPHILGNMALGPNGDIFIADRALPLIFVKPASEQKLQAVLALTDFVSQRGVALRPDGRLLYVADREMGIIVVDFKERQARALQVPDTLNLGGLDGLYLDNNRLFVIQNGISPQRVMRLQLDESGTKVVTVRPLAVAQPEFDFPSFGAIVGDELYYFANSQGAGKKGSLKPVTVLRTPLDANEDLVQPDMEYFLKKQAERKKQSGQADKDN